LTVSGQGDGTGSGKLTAISRLGGRASSAAGLRTLLVSSLALAGRSQHLFLFSFHFVPSFVSQSARQHPTCPHRTVGRRRRHRPLAILHDARPRTRPQCCPAALPWIWMMAGGPCARIGDARHVTRWQRHSLSLAFARADSKLLVTLPVLLLPPHCGPLPARHAVAAVTCRLPSTLFPPSHPASLLPRCRARGAFVPPSPHLSCSPLREHARLRHRRALAALASILPALPAPPPACNVTSPLFAGSHHPA
jgi:hypothetical protein